ncbi:2-hydroxychromene-2-carboxylate isomerase [Celeribacter litoreus]|uniref:2-hydroxychromene-2-carboxylate isomerase n=1 Tax=Celeribacter litoreus TaxID=2876714 RepID=UPI001CCC69EC|nr:2-hydroxychromene-2-carboxylate isomerase [Celeribacter litoreus]MCA0042763.1 2-hydroxychromene-2-carboxylate isomerase [Celeribacter litoreus]
MAHIDYYFSFLSAWIYLADGRLEKIAEKHGATVSYKPFDLMTAFDRLGVPRPANRGEGRKVYRMQELKRLKAKTGLPMNVEPPFWPTNVAPAAYAVIAAQNAGGGDMGTLVNGLSAAMWRDDKDIAQDEVITEALKTAGFDPMLSMTGMLEGAETYPRNLEEGLAAGVFGSPFYIVKETDERFWGRDRLDMLDEHLATL